MDCSFHVKNAGGGGLWAFEPTGHGCMTADEDNGGGRIYLHGTPDEIREFCAKLLVRLPQEPAPAPAPEPPIEGTAPVEWESLLASPESRA